MNKNYNLCEIAYNNLKKSAKENGRTLSGELNFILKNLFPTPIEKQKTFAYIQAGQLEIFSIPDKKGFVKVSLNGREYEEAAYNIYAEKECENLYFPEYN